MSSFNYRAVSKINYQEFYINTQKLLVGPMLLPEKWESYLWGILVYNNSTLIGGWVGRKRIHNLFLSKLYQEVVFDSHPQIFIPSDNIEQEIVNVSIKLARKEQISLLSISHWSRNNIRYLNKEFKEQKCATFIINLSNDLWSELDSKQRNIIRKAERNLVSLQINTNISQQMIDDFQNLRFDTQKRAIHKNEKSSMLLKSTSFINRVVNELDCNMGICYIDNHPASAALMLSSGKTMFYYLGGSNIELNRKAGASAYLIWNMIVSSKKAGNSYFDMGGVPTDHSDDNPACGVYNFKKSFGGEYVEFVCGDFVISKMECGLMNFFKKNNIIKRIISKKL
jgi:hypothetical protein